jgi:hypothetical protein
MKNFVKNYVLFLLLICLIIYIAGSFVELSFYITLWEECTRAYLGLLWACILLIYTMIVVIDTYS